MCDIFEYDESVVKQRLNPVTKRYEEIEKMDELYYPAENSIPHFFVRQVRHLLGAGIPKARTK